MIPARGTRSRKRIINLGSDPGTFAVAAVSAFTCSKSLESNGSRDFRACARTLLVTFNSRKLVFIYRLAYRVFM